MMIDMPALSRFMLLAALPMLLMLSACDSSREEVTGLPSSYYRMSPTPPPVAPFEEKQQVADPLHEIWRPGYWSYDGVSFSWVPGHVMPKPEPTAAWSTDRWDEHTFGWGFVPGHWQ